MKAGPLEGKAMQEESDRDHIEIMGTLQEIRDQLRQVRNEFVY